MYAPDLGSGIAGLALGLWLVYEGRELGLGDLRDPGSGFLLFWVGVILAVLSAALAAASLLRARRAVALEGDSGAKPQFGERWRNVPIVIAYLVLYAGLLETVGFIPLTILLLMLLFRTVEPQPWRVAIVYSVLATLTVYLLFGAGLGTQFPKGLLDPGAIEWSLLAPGVPGRG